MSAQNALDRKTKKPELWVRLLAPFLILIFFWLLLVWPFLISANKPFCILNFPLSSVSVGLFLRELLCAAFSQFL